MSSTGLPPTSSPSASAWPLEPGELREPGTLLKAVSTLSLTGSIGVELAGVLSRRISRTLSGLLVRSR